MAPIAFFNWNFVDTSKPQLLLSDLGLLRGYGIFDFFNVINGKPIFLEAHLDRFFQSARSLHLEVPLNREEILQVIEELLNRNGESNAGMRLLLTGGYSEGVYQPGKPNLAILQQAYGEPPPAYYESGISLITQAFQRELPAIKTTNYLNGIRMLPVLKEKEALEPLYHDHGYVRESVRSNIFIVDPEGRLLTPDKRILLGITRKKVLEVASGLSIPVQTRSIRLKELQSAKEIFITGTFKRILPVSRIDGKKISDGKPGSVTRMLMDALEKERKREMESLFTFDFN